MSIFKQIQCNGFILREFDQSDVYALAEIEFDSEVKQYLGFPKQTKEEWIQDIKDNKIEILGWIIQTDENQVAGHCALSRYKPGGYLEVRVVIGKQFWGRNLGTKITTQLVNKAFQHPNTKAMIAVIHPNNRASLNIIRALGFRRRGIITGNSGRVGHYVYRLTRNGYNQKINHKTVLDAMSLK